ncbi:MAG: ABC transporter substrate binding protein [Candidatus Eremiobacteraeota bacterium]|nr:ABC transporter substrate binding protein [Candidatus Eremiobacteraeota bacterium]
MELWLGALNLGFLYAFMACGVFLTFRVLKIADITVDGSFTTGAAVSAVILMAGHPPFMALLAGFAAGALAGALTGIIYTRYRIHSLLAGILVMIGLYSVNLHIMEKSNIPLNTGESFITFLLALNAGLPGDLWIPLCLFLCTVMLWCLSSLGLKTDIGITLRAAGDNPRMAAAQGVNVDMMSIGGLALANGLVGISGGLVAQYQGFADISMGIGTIMTGLASIILGEHLVKSRSIAWGVASALIGSLLYRLMVALVLYMGLNPIDLKLFTSVLVLIILSLSGLFGETEGKKPAKTSPVMKYALAGGVIALLLVMALMEKQHSMKAHRENYRIGVVQLTENGMLDTTRESFLREMTRLGYAGGKNCEFLIQNAQGDMATLNTILDKLVMSQCDVIVTISSAATQAATSRVKRIPVVFATVADPFVIKVGSSEKDHLANITGVYGSVPMDETVRIVETLFPRGAKIGTLWDPGQFNSVFNVEALRKALEGHSKLAFRGATVTNTSEVYQAALSLSREDIDVYVLPPDNLIYSAFDAVVKASGSRKIPIIINDITRVQEGALICFGYDYAVSGEQAAHLVKRILKGESPGDIPFERYRTIELAVNLKVADGLKIKLPLALLDRATVIIDERGVVRRIHPGD